MFVSDVLFPKCLLNVLTCIIIIEYVLFLLLCYCCFVAVTRVDVARSLGAVVVT